MSRPAISGICLTLDSHVNADKREIFNAYTLYTSNSSEKEPLHSQENGHRTKYLLPIAWPYEYYHELGPIGCVLYE